MRALLERKQLAIGIGLLVAILAINALIAYRLTSALHDDARRVDHTHEVLWMLERIAGTITQAETGQRGYLITGDVAYLAPYEAAVASYRDTTEAVASATADNPRQQERISRLKELIDARLEVLKENIDLRTTEGFDAARRSIVTGTGKGFMDRLRSLIDEMRQEELDLLRLRTAANDATYRQAILAVVISFVVGVATVVAFVWLLRRHLRSLKRSAAEIHERRELLHATLASIGDGVVATDERGRVTFLNQVAQHLTGWTQDDAQGQPLEEVLRIVHEETRRPVDNPAVRAMREGRVVGLANHTVLISRSGAECPIDDSAAPITTVSGKVSGAILVFREIGQRRTQERELARQTAALADADRRKDEFLAMLAHELRNPLAPISNALQIWPLVESDSAEMERLREMMARQIRQLTRLVDDLLDVSRITRGKLQLKTEIVDLRTLVTGAVEGVQPFIDERAHALSVDLPPGPLLIDGDPARLTQVFGNILSNAAKYTGRNGRIGIVAERQATSALVRIRDNGPGIPPHMLTRVFEMFHQVDETLDRANGGLGIGLTLVRRLVQLHDGKVEVRSDGPGLGSEFVVSLPALPDRYVPPEVPVAISRDDPPPAAFRRLRILVVDDVRAAANTLALMLRSIGHDTSMAHDGQGAIDSVVGNRPDVVFLDVGLPDIDGYEAARRIRRQPELAGVVLVALTGHDRDEDRREALDAGFDHHLIKPASVDILTQLLATIGGACAVRRD